MTARNSSITATTSFSEPAVGPLLDPYHSDVYTNFSRLAQSNDVTSSIAPLANFFVKPDLLSDVHEVWVRFLDVM